MFNFRIKYKGIKFPSPDPTVPAKDFILKMSVWHSNILGEHAIAEGLLPLQPLFLDCMRPFSSPRLSPFFCGLPRTLLATSVSPLSSSLLLDI